LLCPALSPCAEAVQLASEADYRGITGFAGLNLVESVVIDSSWYRVDGNLEGLACFEKTMHKRDGNPIFHCYSLLRCHVLGSLEFGATIM
jgi:hypothetical protein